MKRIQMTGIVVSAILAFSNVTPAIADTYDQIDAARARKEAAEERLYDAQDRVYTLRAEKQDLVYYLQELESEVSSLETEITGCTKAIDEKQTEVERTKAAVKRAKIAERKQYKSMLERIQYMYENGSSDLMVTLLESSDITSFLNKTAEAKEVTEYDRKKLDEYTAAKEAVIEKTEKLEGEKKELAELKTAKETKLAEVQTLAETTDYQIAAYTEKIGIAEYNASAISEEISYQRSRISELVAQANREEAERAAEERRLARLAEEAAKAQDEKEYEESEDESYDEDEVDEDEAYDEDESEEDEDEEYDEDESDEDEEYDEDESEEDEDDAYDEDDSEDDEDTGWEDESYDEDDYDEEDYDEDENSGSSGKYLGNFLLTAYCWCAECNGSYAGQPTASGTTPVEGRTVAMGGVEFGTKLLINGHVYTVEDRGTPYGHVDIFMESHSRGNDFGMQYADVYLVD